MAATSAAMTAYTMEHGMPSDGTATNGTLPLAGIRVLEFCHTIMGPTAGLILADLGADVIKVEPVGGDSTRRLLGFAAGFFAAFNRNKRSLAIDLKSDEGRALLHRLVATADVVMENYAPGTMDRLGCGYADFAKINPRLIYCALKGFLSGPYEHRPALDEVVQFMAGLAYMTGPPGQPLRAGASVVDIMGGMFAVIGIQAALRERERTGRGQLVKSALFESTAFLMAQHMAGQAITGRAPPPMPAREGAWAIYEPFATADGEQIFVGLTSDGQWRRFCEHFARDGSAAKSRLQDQRGSRARAARRCGRSSPRSSRGIRSPSLPNCSTASIFRSRRSPSPATCSTIRSSMPAAACSRSIFRTACAAKIPRLPIEIGDHDLALRRQAPAIGEHTAEILAELGLEASRDRGAAPARDRRRQDAAVKRKNDHERSAETRPHQRGRPARGLSVRERRDPDRTQDRADRCAVADRPRPHPDRLVRQSEGGAGHGRRRGRSCTASRRSPTSPTRRCGSTTRDLSAR